LKSHHRIKKLAPVVKIKQSDVDREQVLLRQLLDEVAEAEKAMERYQSLYREGSARVNELRTGGDRGLLASMEAGVDFAKSKWAASFVELKEARLKADAQRMQVLKLRQELKAVEYLVDKYEKEFLQERAQAEQNQLDEFSGSNQARRAMRGF
jgi:flagellar export protein FliJ